ncbi:hypothetical protein VSS37_00875 [Candidatus Thiothrix sp. Deng01]|uniref:Uncharacterized protein n=1 Tax=Candidatus Thiothrix phosphatis TaxID=3112415 RepID=A0ABU6CRW4_9GAMM|nr:hypothetical protein [Candidatus Thiothrix sp. Deng01]MEB4589520.1 hypothetical protein [Candidatus Thiothrix sp. Deng01]
MNAVTVTGHVQAVTNKSILLEDGSTGAEAWYSRKYSTILEGYPAKGEWLRLSVPQWLYDKANGNQPTPAVTGNTGAAIPADMLKRLIHLCHPDKHNGSQASLLATQWLLEQRGRAS